jgi:Anti-sigma regulatory factor (Ser/Thr protein kinase)
MSGLSFDSCTGDHLELAIPYDIDMRGMLAIFKALRFPRTEKPEEQIEYAIIELISNALRAQRERDTHDPVVVRLKIDGPRLEATIIDHGGGFDPAILPFSLDAPIADIDPMAESFTQYRLRNNLARFGMGLIFARKTFPAFSLDFIDRGNNSRSWPSTDIIGTRIMLGIDVPRAHDIPSGEEKRSEARDRCYAQASLASNRILGHVTNISDTGLRIRFMLLVPDPVPEVQELLLSMGELGLPPFPVTARTAWKLDDGASTLLGMKLLSFPDEEAKSRFETLRQYYQKEAPPLGLPA